MSEIPFRIYQVTDFLFDLLGLRKAAVLFSFPDLFAVQGDDKDTTCSWLQSHLSQIGAERTEQFLSKPGGAEQPLALAAIVYFYNGFFCHGLLPCKS